MNHRHRYHYTTYRHVYTPPPPPKPHFTYTTYTYYNYHDPLNPNQGSGYASLDGKLGKKMKIYTYVIFAYNILLALAVILYSSLILNSETVNDCIYIFFFLTMSELVYISISLRIFIKKTLEDCACCYSIVILLTAMFPFITAIVDFTKKNFPIGHYIVFVGGTSILIVMSMIYAIIGFKSAMWGDD